MTPWYRLLTDLGDRSRETAMISIRRAALAIRAKKILIARAETNAPLAGGFSVQISEQLWQ